MLEPPAPWACHPIKYAVPEDLAKGSDAAKYTRLAPFWSPRWSPSAELALFLGICRKNQLTISLLCCSQGRQAALPGSC